MNWAFWFMALQIVICAAGGVIFAIQQNNFWVGWIWMSYAQANIGFAVMAYKG